ncbi:MAG: family 43 glycosylhydrolase [Clostridia bacterium]|nr:family 43 glycosylhydrolase [Clostridia bacterium]
MSAVSKFFVAVIVFICQLLGVFGTTKEYKPADAQNGGDPFIVEDNGSTYYTYTTGSGIVIRKVNSINNLTVLEEKTVYSEGSNGILHSIWAPEIHKIGDRWYIVSCAQFDSSAVPAGTMPYAEVNEEHTDYYRYGFVLESKTDDIFGDYEYKGRLAPDGMNNIDGTYLKYGGKLYYVSSSYLAPAHQCITVTKMENPYTLKADAKTEIISKPQYKWEKKGWWVNEGPAVLYRNEDVYIVYSASGYSSGDYCLGLLSLVGDNPADNRSWYKSPVSVFSAQSDKDLYHPGHCSFLYRDNGDIYMVYHATDNADFFAKPRCTYITKLNFYRDYPIFD